MESSHIDPKSNKPNGFIMIKTDRDFYYPGDTIKGKVLFRPNKALDIKKCYIEVKGLEKIYY